MGVDCVSEEVCFWPDTKSHCSELTCTEETQDVKKKKGHAEFHAFLIKRSIRTDTLWQLGVCICGECVTSGFSSHVSPVMAYDGLPHTKIPSGCGPISMLLRCR